MISWNDGPENVTPLKDLITLCAAGLFLVAFGWMGGTVWTEEQIGDEWYVSTERIDSLEERLRAVAPWCNSGRVLHVYPAPGGGTTAVVSFPDWIGPAEGDSVDSRAEG